MRITQNESRRAAAAVLLLLAVTVYALYPEALELATTGLLAFLLGCVALDVPVAPKKLGPVFAALVFAVSVATLLLLTDMLGGASTRAVLAANPMATLYGLCAVVALMGLFYGVTGSGPWAVRGATVVLALFGFASYYVILFRTMPFTPLDLYGVPTLFRVIGSYRFTFGPAVGVAFVLFMGVFFAAFRVRLLFQTRMLRRMSRVLAFVAAGAFFGVMLTSKWHVDRYQWYPTFFDQSETIAQNGNLVNFLNNVPFLAAISPEGYSTQEVKRIASQYASDSAAVEGVRPDVIIIVGESWADLAPEGKVKTSAPVMPFIKSFKTNPDGLYEDLVVSGIGGGTSMTEYEVLSGASHQFGLHFSPFIVYHGRKIPTLPFLFKQMGYRTVALHNGYRDAWGRDRDFPELGFDAFLDEPDLRERLNVPWNRLKVRNFDSDKLLFDGALSFLEESDAPLFLYAITIQTHGGYADPNYTPTVRIEEPAGHFPQAEQFLSLMRLADRDFAAFMEAVRKRNRPTIVLALGDHLPVVDAGYWQAALQPSLEEFRDTSTFFVMWSNFGASFEPLRAFPAVSTHYLGAAALRSAGLPLTGFHKLLLAGMAELPVISPRGAWSEEIGSTLALQYARRLELFKQQEIMAYNLLHDTGNRPKDFYTLIPAE